MVINAKTGGAVLTDDMPEGGRTDLIEWQQFEEMMIHAGVIQVGEHITHLSTDGQGVHFRVEAAS